MALVFVTGGTGFIGSHSVAALHRAGHRIRLLARRESAVRPALEPLGLHPADVDVVLGDITDATTVTRAMTGCDAVLHAASIYSFDSRAHRRMQSVNVDGTENVLAAARWIGADPIVHVSSFAALIPTRGRPLDGNLPVGKPRERYMATKAEAELIARQHQSDGAPVTITYPMATLGPHDPHLGDQSARLRSLLLGRLPIWPTGGYPLGDVRDVAELHADAMRPGQGPRRLLAPGRYVSTSDYLRTARFVTGHRLPAVFLPTPAVLPVGLLTLALQRICPWHIPVEYGAIYACHCDARLDERTAPAPSRPFAETMLDTVRWLHESGHLTRRAAGRAAPA
ncbi:nucleoside-diphosphate-sugar epimerase [Allocatelliglobosispora scoriae]|uniref:Nucleoside-diphosphate-sugar epimerase n=1 Tax=Allocatelliglobosispora scoriae TaxID=643052 RepID=A0A841BLP5_9ACTN|nr:NAD-dependent epimerase/dehydratase family protein [Allocatelliglobosispora scoriae]MBB5870007.1 nucleoside-diphosphate-sugar epimerase [Allocatelliglobosispora scoriae]